jgi:hypothetical protein
MKGGTGPESHDRLDRHTFSSWPLLVGLATGFSALFGLAAVLVNVLVPGRSLITGSVILVAACTFVGFLLVVRLVRRQMKIVPD